MPGSHKSWLLMLISLLAMIALPLTPALASASYPLGPDIENFPQGYNPLTGLPVSDPSWLDLPAVLVSLSNFPPSVCPQTGLSFASQVYEIYITEGMTRFLAVFYGEPPRVIPNPATGLQPRQQPVSPNGTILGGKVWWDENADGVQQPWEPGLGGVQVTLKDNKGQSLEVIPTDGNGYYAFAPTPNRTYGLQIQVPSGFILTKPNVSDDALDSDADATGTITSFPFKGQTNHQDFGLVSTSANAPGSFTSSNGSLNGLEMPQDAGLSGVRSGREAYVPIANAFPGGCLVAASKSSDVNLRICRNVYGNNPGDINSAGLSLNTLRALAEANRNPQQPPNYSGNLFDPRPPADGKPASQINVFYAYLNQAQWKYDPVAGGYWRFQDYGKEDKVGQFIPALDRLTGPLLFENVVILFVEHVARRPTIIDLNMGPGSKGRAIVFRNGQIYTNLVWSMVGENYEKQTGLSRPIRLRYADGRPFPLAPGQTWFHVATPASYVQEVAGQPGTWKFRFYPPVGAK